MRLLFAMTVSCFCAVLWVALALARRVRSGQAVATRPRRRPRWRQEFFEAGEFRTPRPLRLEQEILQQRPRRTLAEISLASDRPAPVPSRPSLSRPSLSRPSLSRPSLSQSSWHRPSPSRSASAVEMPKRPGPVPIIASASQSAREAQSGREAQTGPRGRPATASVSLPADRGSLPTPVPAAAPTGFTDRRIPPQPERLAGLRRRVDLSHFHTEMGDLTDPSYNQPQRGSGTRGPIPVHRRGRQ